MPAASTRATVQLCITTYVEKGASDALALEAFNGLVRKELPRVLAASFGVAIICFPALASKLDEAAGLLANGFSVRDVTMTVLYGIFLSCAYFPLLAFLAVHFAKLSLNTQLRGVAANILALFLTVLHSLISNAVYVVHYILYRFCRKSSTGVVLYIGLTLATLIATACIFHLWPTAQSKNRYLNDVDLDPSDLHAGYPSQSESGPEVKDGGSNTESLRGRHEEESLESELSI